MNDTVDGTNANVPTGNPSEPSEAQAPGEVAAGSDQDPNAKPDQEEKPKRKRDWATERRIRKLKRENAELREHTKATDEKLAKLESQIQSMSQPRRPQRDDFETQEAYEDAVVDYKLSLREEKPADPSPAKSDPDPDPGLTQDWRKYVAKQGESFANVVAKAHFPCSDAMLREIVDSGDLGVELFQHFNDNPAVAAKLVNLPADRVADEFEAIADSLDASPPSSSAPKPINPVDGNDSVPADESKMSPTQRVRRDLKKMHGR